MSRLVLSRCAVASRQTSFVLSTQLRRGFSRYAKTAPKPELPKPKSPGSSSSSGSSGAGSSSSTAGAGSAHGSQRVLSARVQRWMSMISMLTQFGTFRILRWGLGLYLLWRYRDGAKKTIKYGVMIGMGVMMSVFWIRFGVFRWIGRQTYETRTLLPHFRTRFEQVFIDFQHLRTMPLMWLCSATFVRWIVMRPHKRWMRSIQRFFHTYPPLIRYTGEWFQNGMSIRPMMVQHGQNGEFVAYLKWFVQRNQEINHMGVMDIKVSGNKLSRVVTVESMKLHMSLENGGNVVHFDPFRLSIDYNWDAQLLGDLRSKSKQYSPETKLRDRLRDSFDEAGSSSDYRAESDPTSVISRKLKKKRNKQQSKKMGDIQEAEYTITESNEKSVPVQ